MVEECKNLEKKAKGLENEKIDEAIKFYKQAAECYNKNDKKKNGDSCFLKAAKLIRENAKVTVDPVKALEIFKSASDIYSQISKQGESEKTMAEAYKRFIDSAKSLRAGAKKAEEPDLAETKLAKASDHASRGNDEELSKACWVDSGELFRKKSADTDKPR